MSKKVIKNEEKRLVSIFVRTAINVPNCEEAIKDCISKIDPDRFEVVYDILRSKVRIKGGTFTTLVLVVGENPGGMERSGMKAICNCLQTTGYYIQFIPSYYSCIPPAKNKI